MRQCQLPLDVVDFQWLTVGSVRSACRSISAMCDRYLSLWKLLHRLRNKNLADQTQVLMRIKKSVMVDDDSTALLPPVLQRIKTVIGHPGRICLVV